VLRAAGLALATALVLGLAATAAAGSSSLVVVSRPARVTYSSSNALAGLAKGSGTDTNTLSVDLFVRHGDGRAIFTIPRGQRSLRHERDLHAAVAVTSPERSSRSAS
jgi:hypothetical protein